MSDRLQLCRRVLRVGAMFAAAALLTHGAAWAIDPAPVNPADPLSFGAPIDLNPQDGPADPPWPKAFDTEIGEVLLYQPEIAAWDQRTLNGRIAVSVQPEGNDPIYGELLFSASTAPADQAHVRLFDVQVAQVSFPAAGDQAERFSNVVRGVIPQAVRIVPAAALTASIERTQQLEQAESAKFEYEPPTVVVSHEPAVLASLSGDPVLNEIPGTKLLTIVNTKADILLDAEGSRYYFATADAWISAPDLLDGPWSWSDAPPGVEDIPDDHPRAAVKQVKNDYQQGPAPQVIVTTEPAELVTMDGPPGLTPIRGTKLFYVSNSPNDVFKHLGVNAWYVLLSGRWYTATDLDRGPWTPIAAEELPPDFLSIPYDSPKANVLVSVPGTPAAQEAVLLTRIPQMATVKRDAPPVNVVYDGEPAFTPIDGTELTYATNTNYEVVGYQNRYYAVYQGAWFNGPSPSGPWLLADTVPRVIYTIPPSCPLYHVTYVHVYGSGPGYVTYGYRPGYMGTYVSNRCVVFGTGYRYRPYVSPRRGLYFSWPVTWGGGWSFNLLTGGFGYRRNYYTPYQCGYVRAGWNPTMGCVGYRVQRFTPYALWDRGYCRPANNWINVSIAANLSNRRGDNPAFDVRRGGLTFVGRDGNAYRRSGDDWQRYGNGRWDVAQLPREVSRRIVDDRDRERDNDRRPDEVRRPGAPTRPRNPDFDRDRNNGGRNDGGRPDRDGPGRDGDRGGPGRGPDRDGPDRAGPDRGDRNDDRGPGRGEPDRDGPGRNGPGRPGRGEVDGDGFDRGGPDRPGRGGPDRGGPGRGDRNDDRGPGEQGPGDGEPGDRGPGVPGGRGPIGRDNDERGPSLPEMPRPENPRNDDAPGRGERPPRGDNPPRGDDSGPDEPVRGDGPSRPGRPRPETPPAGEEPRPGTPARPENPTPEEARPDAPRRPDLPPRGDNPRPGLPGINPPVNSGPDQPGDRPTMPTRPGRGGDEPGPERIPERPDSSARPEQQERPARPTLPRNPDRPATPDDDGPGAARPGRPMGPTAGDPPTGDAPPTTTPRRPGRPGNPFGTWNPSRPNEPANSDRPAGDGPKEASPARPTRPTGPLNGDRPNADAPKESSPARPSLPTRPQPGATPERPSRPAMPFAPREESGRRGDDKPTAKRPTTPVLPAPERPSAPTREPSETIRRPSFPGRPEMPGFRPGGESERGGGEKRAAPSRPSRPSNDSPPKRVITPDALRGPGSSSKGSSEGRSRPERPSMPSGGGGSRPERPSPRPERPSSPEASKPDRSSSKANSGPSGGGSSKGSGGSSKASGGSKGSRESKPPKAKKE